MEQHTWIGRSLNDRYKIDALLGQGGMSAVYKAMDPNLKRVVAIKLIHPHLSTDIEFVYRFRREAAAVAAFRHPNIVQVYDFNNDGDVYYMVLEFIPGETLQDRLKHLKKTNTRMPLPQAIRYLINICDALGYAHKQGMIHRDIKPANIMLDVQGQAILMDFGIVKILDSTAHTTTGALLGTARYMSPEVIRSEMPDERSDIYSLGVTFYEMLSGDPPFEADSAMSLLMRHLNDPVPDLNSKRQDLPPALIRIVNKSLEKDRNDRYRSAGELAADLKRLLAALETDSVSPSMSSAGEFPAPIVERTEPWDISKPSQPQSDLIYNTPTMADRPAQKVEAIKSDSTAATMAGREVPKPSTGSRGKPASKASIPAFLKFGAIGLVVLCIAMAGILAWNVSSWLKQGDEGAIVTQTVDRVEMATTPTNPPTNTPAPTGTPTDTPVPPTPTPTTPYVLITGIRLENNKYVVDYQPHNFPDSPSLHVHMFFDTVPPEQAGSPGSGPWKLTWGAYGDPPFTQYGPANRPALATQMCALVANPNHSVNLNSGNCFDLPTTESSLLTPTPSAPYALITGIRLEGDKYIVDFETHNFPEASGLHVHMFFDTVPPEQAGMPGSGPWKMTGGEYGTSPFTQYGPANRPETASQMCVLVVTPDHTVIHNSGNCFDLPQ